MIIYFNKTGPLMRYRKGSLIIEDLNPVIQTSWAMKRIEMLGIAWRCFRAALTP